MEEALKSEFCLYGLFGAGSPGILSADLGFKGMDAVYWFMHFRREAR